MGKPKNITIEIPQPCLQDWGQMEPSAQGRFCNNCQKEVIDFTLWSDARLYQFFAGNNGHVCGRFLTTQVGRGISLPPQPHSRLYRIAIAMGLTLLFTQAGSASAQPRAPMAQQNAVGSQVEKKDGPESNGRCIRGTILDNKKEPLINASIRVLQGGKMVAGAITDYDGRYIVTPLDPGLYDINVSYVGYNTASQTQVVVAPHDTTTANFTMAAASNCCKGEVIIGYRKPLIEPYRNTGKVLRAEDIKTKPVVHPDTIVPVRTIR